MTLRNIVTKVQTLGEHITFITNAIAFSAGFVGFVILSGVVQITSIVPVAIFMGITAAVSALCMLIINSFTIKHPLFLCTGWSLLSAIAYVLLGEPAISNCLSEYLGKPIGSNWQGIMILLIGVIIAGIGSVTRLERS